MREADKMSFGKLLADVMKFYKETVTPFALDVWWDACRDFDRDHVAKAFSTHARDPDRGQWAPKPADIVRILSGTQADQALVAWGKLLHAIKSVGAYESVQFDDRAIHSAVTDLGGWVAVCRSKTDELPFIQRRFCDAYRVYCRRDNHPTYLMGEHEATNRLAGMPVSNPAVVGAKPAIESENVPWLN